MNLKIRKGVFETNSSSMHSLAVKAGKDEYDYELPLDKEGVWRLGDGELDFGRFPFRLLCSFEEKCRYAIAQSCYIDNDEEYYMQEVGELLDIIRECNPAFNALVFFKDEYGEQHGTVDDFILDDALIELSIDIREFLTNTKYMVVVDGDEYCIFSDACRFGLVDTDKLEQEVGDIYG